MATHASIIAWRIPRTEAPGGLLQSVWLQKLKQLNMHAPMLRNLEMQGKMCQQHAGGNA